ncbi:hypothetical protein ACYFX5_01585 [Bremerella sp. T1]|uniref:hypothetical protein n=1 Tax=Bremerella sp. TYQ1 TaxID=3119568 RepID=UPI0021BC99B6|nr:hypothetical protein [Bremerella volcania]
MFCFSSMMHAAEHLCVTYLESPIDPDVKRNDVVDVLGRGGQPTLQTLLAQVVIQLAPTLGDPFPVGVVALRRRRTAPYLVDVPTDSSLRIAPPFQTLRHGTTSIEKESSELVLAALDVFPIAWLMCVNATRFATNQLPFGDDP